MNIEEEERQVGIEWKHLSEKGPTMIEEKNNCQHAQQKQAQIKNNDRANEVWFEVIEHTILEWKCK